MSTYDLNVYVEAINNARSKSNGILDAHHAIDLVAYALADLIERDNPGHFDKAEFFRATSTVPPSE